MTELRPRIRATQLLKLPEPERQAALDEIEDGPFKAMVCLHLQNREDRIQGAVDTVMREKTTYRRDKAISAVPAFMREEVKRRVDQILMGGRSV